MTRHLNDTSVTDICEIGGDFATMRDVHYEVKCWNSLIKSTTVGRGSWDNGGNVASVGHLYGFGNTLDKALTGVGVQGAWPSRWTDRSTTRLESERDGSKTTRMETGARCPLASWARSAVQEHILGAANAGAG